MNVNSFVVVKMDNFLKYLTYLLTVYLVSKILSIFSVVTFLFDVMTGLYNPATYIVNNCHDIINLPHKAEVTDLIGS